MTTYDEVDAARLEAQLSLLRRINENTNAANALRYAEAFAWLAHPGQAHGGSSDAATS